MIVREILAAHHEFERILGTLGPFELQMLFFVSFLLFFIYNTLLYWYIRRNVYISLYQQWFVNILLQI